MARVNHKLVKQRLNEKRSKITDKQFFSSRMLAGHFEDLAAAQTRRYHYNRRVRVNLYWKPKDAFTAATDNMQIRINTGHPLVTKVKGRENRYQLVCGMFAHELGHVLFTDFLSAQTYHNYLDSFKWYPRPPAFRLAADARNEKAFWEYVKENEAAQSISYGDIHSGVNIRVNRIASVDPELVEQYDAICNPLISISRQLQKSLLRQLKENRRGGKQTGLIMGRRLDAHALCRNDGKVFYKNNLPNEIPELAVGLLLDESGSMCSCDRCTYARAAAIILYDFCESLEIPVMVYGHSTDYYDGKDSVELYSYAEFNGFDNDDKYRLMDISARGSNRDGAALRYVAEVLSKRSEAVKLLILVSDGQPADTGYYGTAAEEDLRGIKQEYQRKGILFVAAAIGNDKQNIERIYGDSFLDITDLNQLPTKLTGVVKRHIRV